MFTKFLQNTNLKQFWQDRTPQQKKYIIFAGVFVLKSLLNKYKKYKAEQTPKNCILELDLQNLQFVNYPLPEQSQFINKILKKPMKYEFTHLLETLHTAAEDPNVSGLIVKLNSYNTFGLAQLDELMAGLKYFKSKGKKTVAYCDSLGLGHNAYVQVYFASVFDKIFVNPSGIVCIQGITATQPFAKQTLEKLGINLEVYKRKNYKNALNVLCEDKFDEHHKESVFQIVSTIENHIKKNIAENRGIENIEEVVKGGPYSSLQEATEKKLIDGAKYRDEVYDYIKDELFKDVKINYLFLTQYMEKKERLYLKGKDNKKVVLLSANGAIHEGESKTPDDFSDEQKIGCDTVARQLRKAYNDKNVIGIILRIDSPGGSAIASEVMNREVQNAMKKGKKVICQYSNVSASGGVYMSVNADKILCTPLTITGSIGVIWGHFNFRKMWEKIGVTFDSLRTENTPESHYFSQVDNTTEEDKKKINTLIDQFYGRFKQLVGSGRKLNDEEVEERAQGRVWMGVEAVERKLVDEAQNGTYLDSIKAMADLTETPLKDIKLSKYPEQKSLIQKLLSDKKPAQNEQDKDKKAEAKINQISTQNPMQSMLNHVFGTTGYASLISNMIQNQKNGGIPCYTFCMDSMHIQSALMNNGNQIKLF